MFSKAFLSATVLGWSSLRIRRKDHSELRDPPLEKFDGGLAQAHFLGLIREEVACRCRGSALGPFSGRPSRRWDHSSRWHGGRPDRARTPVRNLFARRPPARSPEIAGRCPALPLQSARFQTVIPRGVPVLWVGSCPPQYTLGDRLEAITTRGRGGLPVRPGQGTA